jgi:hypothetical protein
LPSTKTAFHELTVCLIFLLFFEEKNLGAEEKQIFPPLEMKFFRLRENAAYLTKQLSRSGFSKRNFTSLSASSYTKDFSSFDEFLKGKL